MILQLDISSRMFQKDEEISSLKDVILVNALGQVDSSGNEVDETYLPVYDNLFQGHITE